MSELATDLLGRPLPLDPWGVPMIDPAVRWLILLTDFMADEGCPSSLPGWANYLAGHEEWHGWAGDVAPLAQPGQEFAAFALAYRYAEAVVTDGRVVLPPCPADCAIDAVVGSCGEGWTEDDMVQTEAQAREALREAGGGWVVFREHRSHPCRVRYELTQDGQPRCRAVPMAGDRIETGSGDAEAPDAAPDGRLTSISPAAARNSEWEAGHGNTPAPSGAADLGVGAA